MEGTAMTTITIPPEAVEAAARAMYFAFTEVNIGDGEDRWERLLPRYRAEYREQATAAILAALSAWPGVDYRPGAKVTKTWRDPGKIILPLPTEKSDGE